MCGKIIEQKEFVKYLGIRIDNCLKWTQHISHVNSKISQGIGVICRLRFLLPLKSLLNIYFSFIQSHILYGITIWGNGKSSAKTKLIHSINKCIKLMTYTNKDININQIYSNNKILTFNNLLILESCKLAYAFFHGLLPNNLIDMFNHKQVNCHNSRNSQNSKFSHSAYNQV